MPDAYDPTPDDRFSFGLWTVGNPGRDPFGAPTRAASEPARLVAKLAECGAWGVNLHDEDLVPFGSSAAERDRIVGDFQAALQEHGMTVPMATTIEECEELCKVVEETGLKYMMAETVVYSREFLYIKELYDNGELGKIQYLAASHPQDMDGWPEYWERMIPMHYATHVVSPCLGMVDGLAEYVSCFGSGTVRDDIAEKSGNKFAVETCHIKLKDSDLSAHVWRFLYDVARQYRESIDVYGTKKSFEWTLVENEPSIVHVAKRPEAEIPEQVAIPDYAHLLPEPIQKFTQTIEDADHLSFVQGGGHGGSHPHMVNEFASALVEDRDPWPNAVTSANWTCVGICAHQSAEQGGQRVNLPEFTLG